MKKYLPLALCLFVTPVLAQTVEQDGANDKYGMKTDRAERVFIKYHMAMHAAELCRGQQIGPDDRLAMDKAIAQRMTANSPDVAVGAARLLTLIPQADSQIADLVSKQGCDGDDVKKSLQAFDDKLATAPGVSVPPPAPAATADATQVAAPAVEVAPESLAPAGQ